MESIITALITGGLALIGTALTVSSSQKRLNTNWKPHRRSQIARLKS